MKLKVIALVLLGLVTTLAACEPREEETPTETISPAQTPVIDATPVETPSPTPS